MNGRQYGPYIVEVENRQNTNTWLHMKLYEGKNNEIRRVMRKQSLRVNRLIRTKYGPYTLGQVPEPNMITEVPVVSSLRRIMFQYYRDRTKQANTMVREQEDKKTVKAAQKAFRDASKAKLNGGKRS